MYDNGRYFTVTGRLIDDCVKAVKNRPSMLARLHVSIFGTGAEAPKAIPHELNGEGDAAPLLTADEIKTVLAKIEADGGKLADLVRGDWRGCGYTSQSEADLAFCTLAAPYCLTDRNRIDRLYRASKLMRKKWDRDDYRNETLDKAITSASTRAVGGERALKEQTQAVRLVDAAHEKGIELFHTPGGDPEPFVTISVDQHRETMRVRS